jgi:DNA invertase Pin-like site-specific DNA recombinase
VLQREACLAVIAANAHLGWIAVDERFDDEGESGADTDRPGLYRLVEGVVDGLVDRVLVHRLDRLTRRAADWAQIASIFREHDVAISVVDGGIHGAADAITRFRLNTLAVFAEFERDMIAERLRDARAARRARGLRVAGRLPLGYVADRATKQLVIVPEEAEIVRGMFADADAGMLPAAIAARAKDRRLVDKSGKTESWNAKAVLRILRKPELRGAPSRRYCWRASRDRGPRDLRSRRREDREPPDTNANVAARARGHRRSVHPSRPARLRPVRQADDDVVDGEGRTPPDQPASQDAGASLLPLSRVRMREDAAPGAGDRSARAAALRQAGARHRRRDAHRVRLRRAHLGAPDHPEPSPLPPLALPRASLDAERSVLSIVADEEGVANWMEVWRRIHAEQAAEIAAVNEATVTRANGGRPTPSRGAAARSPSRAGIRGALDEAR